MKDKRQGHSKDLGFSPSSSTVVSKTISDPSALCDAEIKKFLYPDRSEINNALPHNSPPLKPSELDTELVPIAWTSSPVAPSLASTPLTAKEHDLQEKINTLTYLLQQRIKLCDKLQTDLAFKNRLVNQMNNNAIGQELQLNELQSQFKAIQTGHLHAHCQAEIHTLNDVIKEQRDLLKERSDQMEKLQTLVYQLQTEFKTEVSKAKSSVTLVPKKEVATWTTLELNQSSIYLPCGKDSKQHETQLHKNDGMLLDKLPLASLDTLVDCVSSIEVGTQVEEDLISNVEATVIPSGSNLLPKAMYTHIEVTAILSFIYLVLFYASVESAKNHALNRIENKSLSNNKTTVSVSTPFNSNTKTSQIQRVLPVDSSEYVTQGNAVFNKKEEEKQESNIPESLTPSIATVKQQAEVSLPTSMVEIEVSSKEVSTSQSQPESFCVLDAHRHDERLLQHSSCSSPSSNNIVEVELESNVVHSTSLSKVDETGIVPTDMTKLSSFSSSTHLESLTQEKETLVLVETNQVQPVTLIKQEGDPSPWMEMESDTSIIDSKFQPNVENNTDSNVDSSTLPESLHSLDPLLRDQTCFEPCKNHAVQIAIQVSLKGTTVMQKKMQVELGSNDVGINKTEEAIQDPLANFSEVEKEPTFPHSSTYPTPCLEHPSASLHVNHNPPSTSIPPQALSDVSIANIQTKVAPMEYHVQELLHIFNELPQDGLNPWSLIFAVKEKEVFNVTHVLKEGPTPTVTLTTHYDTTGISDVETTQSCSEVKRNLPDSLKSKKSIQSSTSTNNESHTVYLQKPHVPASNHDIKAESEIREMASNMAMDVQRPLESKANTYSAKKCHSALNDTNQDFNAIETNELLPSLVKNSETLSSASQCKVDDFNPGIQWPSTSPKNSTLPSPMLEQEPSTYQYLLYRLRFSSGQCQRQNDRCKVKPQVGEKWIQKLIRFQHLPKRALTTAVNLKSMSVHYLASTIHAWTSFLTPLKSHPHGSKHLALDETLNAPLDLLHPIFQTKVTTPSAEEKKLFELGSSSVVNLCETHDKSNYVTPSPSFSSLNSKCMESGTCENAKEQKLNPLNDVESHVDSNNDTKTHSHSTSSSFTNQHFSQECPSLVDTMHETTVPNDLHSVPAGLSATTLASIFFNQMKKGTKRYVTHTLEHCSSYLPTPVTHAFHHYVTPFVPAFLTKETLASPPSSSFSSATVIHPPSSVFSNPQTGVPIVSSSSSSSSVLNSKTSILDTSHSKLCPLANKSNFISYSKAPLHKLSRSTPIPSSPCTSSTSFSSSPSSPSGKKGFISGLVETAITLPSDVRQNGLLKTAKHVLF